MSQRFLTTLVGLLIFFCLIQPVSAQLSISTNRSQFSPQDNIILEVETTNPNKNDLDISPLHSQFLIINQKKIMINSYAEGKRSSIVRWEILLRARRSGYVDIPSLSYNKEASNKLSIFIKSSNRTRFLPISDMPIILDAQLDSDDNYEGALFLYTLNIYSDRPLNPDYQISKPKLANGEVRLLEQSETKKIEIRGKEYNVIEQHYAIFPREMGRYIIEGPIFNGSQHESNNIQVRANNLEINVRTRRDFENKEYWLPAKNVSMEEQWQKTETLKVGDIIYREVTIKVQGIFAKNLPTLITSNPEIIDIKETKVTLTNQISKQGVQGIRTERQKIQLLERGEITVPRIRIYWWDTNTDSQRSSSIDKKILQVMPGANGESSIEREMAQNKSPTLKPQDIITVSTQTPWLIWSLALFALIATLGWIFNLRKMKNIREQQQEGFEIVTKQPLSPDPEQNNSSTQILSNTSKSFNAKAELNTFQILGRACIKNDLISTQSRLLEWANQFWYEQKFNEIQEIASAANDPLLSELLTEMQDLLDSYNTSQWQGKATFNRLTVIRAK